MNDTVKQIPNWQKNLEKLLLAFLHEQRSRRRWGIFFKIIILGMIGLTLWSFTPFIELGHQTLNNRHTSLIDIKGIIMDDKPANADDIVGSINSAFNDPQSDGIILRINSPGGSPVQASYIYDAIKRLKKEHPKTKLYAVCTDLCASAAYYIAAASDFIYANPASMVGSIGVIWSGFGAVNTLEKLGIERRVSTAGSNKNMLDPFLPLRSSDQAHLQNMLDEVHLQFISDVQNGRGDRLVQSPRIFSGLIWTGTQAKKLGLIDDFASPGTVAREIIKNGRIVNYTHKVNYFEHLVKKFGASFADKFTMMSGIKF